MKKKETILELIGGTPTIKRIFMSENKTQELIERISSCEVINRGGKFVQVAPSLVGEIAAQLTAQADEIKRLREESELFSKLLLDAVLAIQVLKDMLIARDLAGVNVADKMLDNIRQALNNEGV
jgi:hypothetical protein